MYVKQEQVPSPSAEEAPLNAATPAHAHMHTHTPINVAAMPHVVALSFSSPLDPASAFKVSLFLSRAPVYFLSFYLSIFLTPGVSVSVSLFLSSRLLFYLPFTFL